MGTVKAVPFFERTGNMKRSNGEGTVYFNEKRQRYEGQFSYFDKDTQTKKRKFFSSKKSAKEVLRKAREFKSLQKKGVNPIKSDIQLGIWLDDWLKNYKQNTVRLKTYERYQTSIKMHLKPYIGKYKLKALSTDIIQRHWTFLLEKGGVEQSGLAARTVNATRRLLIQALNDAVDLGYIEKNSALKTKPIKTSRSEIRILTRDEALRLMTVAKEYDMVAWIVVVIALGTGMRLSEIFGLSWSCIDFRSAKLYVEQSAVKTNHGTVIQNEVKTKNSRREVPLPKFVVQALIEYKRWQEFYKIKNTGLFVDRGYVIANQYGNVRHPASFSYHVFKKALLPRAGISEKVRFHDLRHTHATWLLASGVNVKIVSERLGHSTIRITLDTYAHVIRTMQTVAVEKLDNIYLGEDPMKQIE